MVMITPPSPVADSQQPTQKPKSDSSPQIVVGGGSLGSDFGDAAALLADTMDDVPVGSPSGEVASRATAEAKPQAADASAIHQEDPGNPQSAIRNPQSDHPPPIEPPAESISSFDLDPNTSEQLNDSRGSTERETNPKKDQRSPLEKAGAAAVVAMAHPPAQQPVESTAGATMPPPVSHPAYSTPAQLAWQRYGLIGAASLAAICMVGGLLFFLLRGPREEVTAEAPAPPEDIQPIIDPDEQPVTPPADDPATPTPEDPPVVDETPTDPPDDPTPSPDDLNIVDEPPPEDEPGMDDPMPDAPPLFTNDPPETPDDSPLDEPTADTGLGDLAPLIDAFPLPPAPDPVAPAIDEVPEGPAPAPIATASRPRPDPVRVNLKARLADKIAGIDTQGAPLVKVLELLTQLSTIPITLSPEALAQHKLQPDVPVDVVLKDTTVGETLKAVLARHNLASEMHGDQILVVSAASRGGPRKVDHAVDDLATDEESIAELVEHIQALIAPETWQAITGEGEVKVEGSTLRVTNSFDVQFRVHLFLQKLRVARGLKPRSKFKAELFAEQARWAQAQAKLEMPVRAVYHVDQPLTKILAHLEKTADVSFLIDWQALLEAGWPPHSEAAVVADDVPLAEALNELLGPMDLTYRAIDARTFQITSLAAVTSQPELELYAIGDLLAAGEQSPDELIQRLERRLGPGLFVDSGGPFEIRYDKPSQRLLVRLPQAQQRVVAAALAK